MDYLSEEMPAFKLATIGNRFASGLIDFLGMLIFMVIVGMIFGETYTDADNSFNVTLHDESALTFFAAWIVAFPVMEGLTGQTIGKKFMGTRVWSKNDSKGTLLQSLLRHLLDFLDYFLLIGLIIAANNKNKQRIGDLVANTIVIKNK